MLQWRPPESNSCWQLYKEFLKSIIYMLQVSRESGTLKNVVTHMSLECVLESRKKMATKVTEATEKHWEPFLAYYIYCIWISLGGGGGEENKLISFMLAHERPQHMYPRCDPLWYRYPRYKSKVNWWFSFHWVRDDGSLEDTVAQSEA